MKARTQLAATLAAVLAGVGIAACASASESRPAKPRLYSETREPTTKPAGTVLVIHGGGWQWVGKTTTQTESEEAVRFTSYGWRTINADYRAGKQSLADVVAWYDWIDSRTTGPICAFGRSAGAHLALMLAARRPQIDCVIGHAPITDLRRVSGSEDAARIREEFIPPSFGRRLEEFSPVTHPAAARIPILLATSAGDRLASCRHLEFYARVRPRTRTHCLPAGTEAFMHANVTRRALERERGRERALLREIERVP